MDSLAEYTKGELLETENAYYCERCDKKVDTVKRLCVKKLPPILVIQLKRFDYDFERDAAVKFNDYFEFPRELDMEALSVGGHHDKEGVHVVQPNMPKPIERSILKQNVKFLHNRNQFSAEYFSFMRKLIQC